jgi:membrane protease YdiL (CAAX protease family)
MSFAARRPILTFLLLMYPLAWALVAAAFVLHLPLEPAVALSTVVGILGPAVLVTYWTGGRAAVLRLLSGVLRWRVGVGWYVFALVAMPAFTIPVSMVTGTLPHAAGGWAQMALTYLMALVVGAVFTNTWEEVAWAGFVQSRLTARHGLLIGAVLTGPLFALQHLPIIVANGGGLLAMLVLGAFLVVTAIFFRYVLGATLIDTGGSLLIVGILHASSDAAGAAFGDGWQQLVATVPIALGLLVYRAARRRSANTRTAAVDAAAPVSA